VKLKEKYVEEQSTSAYDDASEKIKRNVKNFEAMFAALRNSNVSDQNSMKLTDAQKKLFEKVIEDANLAIESHNLKALKDSIEDLESFRERIKS
jgi:hypothetical protein